MADTCKLSPSTGLADGAEPPCTHNAAAIAPGNTTAALTYSVSSNPFTNTAFATSTA